MRKLNNCFRCLFGWLWISVNCEYVVVLWMKYLRDYLSQFGRHWWNSRKVGRNTCKWKLHIFRANARLICSLWLTIERRRVCIFGLLGSRHWHWRLTYKITKLVFICVFLLVSSVHVRLPPIQFRLPLLRRPVRPNQFQLFIRFVHTPYVIQWCVYLFYYCHN